jgi:glycosyltransferase involved in cell wall biosynthesis
MEALRVVTAPRRVQLADAGATWLVSTHAYDGWPAVRARRRFSGWVGTSVQGEWRARRSGLSPLRRLAAAASVPVLRRLERRVLRAATAVYATSPASQADLRRATGREDIGILPIAVDIERFRPATEEAWLETLTRPVLLFVGRADDPRKNIAQLLHAAASLAGMQFVLAGRPPREPTPPNVRVLGDVPDVAEVMRRATLFVLPSRQEGFGIVAAEAMACGLPVVTTPCGGPEELVAASEGGVVTRSFQSSDLASALTRILADRGELQAMRQRARSYIEREHSPAAFRAALGAALIAP